MTYQFTKEERELLNRLSKPPKCMHDPSQIISREFHWQCGQCGLIAKKTLPNFGKENKDG